MKDNISFLEVRLPLQKTFTDFITSHDSLAHSGLSPHSTFEYSIRRPDHGLKESNGFRTQMMWSASLATFAALAKILSKTMTRKLSKAVEATSTFCTGDLAALAAEKVSHSRLF